MMQAVARLGRPVDAGIDREVVDEVLQQLRTKGYPSITMEGLARATHRARASLYRRWPSKRHLIAYAIVTTLGAEPSPDSGSLRSDLIAAVQTLSVGFRGSLGAAVAGLVGDMVDDAALARVIRKEVLAKRRRSIRAAFKRGIERHEIRPAIDLDVAIDMLTAPFYFRALFGHAKISESIIESVVDTLLRGLR
jgi:AcrR family transcriptional regulator